MDEANVDLSDTDVAIVIGANDIVNPGALDDPSNPIYGMPIIEMWKARTCIVLTRGMTSGYAGVENPLFLQEQHADAVRRRPKDGRGRARRAAAAGDLQSA